MSAFLSALVPSFYGYSHSFHCMCILLSLLAKPLSSVLIWMYSVHVYLWAVLSVEPNSVGASLPSYLRFGIAVVSEVLHGAVNLI